MPSAYATERELVDAALRELRAEVLEVPAQVRQKDGDLGPLTEMDELMDAHLYRVLHEAYPEDGWISEESPRESGNGRYWIIDPIDGTRELVEGVPEWAVSVGLWQDNRPLCGWLYNPPTDRLWAGGPGLGVTVNGEPVGVRKAAERADLVVGVSRTDLKKGRVPETDPPAEGIGSIAYKLGLVAGGELDATVSVTPKNIWDVAGGIPLVLGAGGAVVRLEDGAPIDRVEEIHAKVERGLVAAHPDWVETLREMYRG